MRFVSRGASSLLALVSLASGVHGDVVQEDLSFGAHGTVWTEDHRSVTGFNLGGEAGYHPEVLSDRIIMTPPWPGNKRASLWADHPEPNEEWIVHCTFRATGPDYASGNMNIWYVHDKTQVETSSIYTVGKFDGLAIIIDQYGGTGGSIRAFMNDGSKSYKDHHHVDSLSFGHCDFAYRNTGRFIDLEVRQSPSKFEIAIDGKVCMSTHKVCFTMSFIALSVY
jgi:lectin, mannose-binding 1